MDRFETRTAMLPRLLRLPMESVGVRGVLGLLVLMAATVAAGTLFEVVDAADRQLAGGRLTLAVAAAVLLGGGLATAGDVVAARRSQGLRPLTETATWSLPFTTAVLAFVGLGPALVTGLVACTAATVTGGLNPSLRRRVAAASRAWLPAVTGVLGSWVALVVCGWEATLAAPWSPDGAGDVLTVALAAAVGSLARASAVLGLSRQPVRRPGEERSSRLNRVAVELAPQWALAPVIVFVMALAPALTILMVLPASALRRAVIAHQHSAHAATHDVLTGLPNRGEFVRLAEHALARRADRLVAVLIVDLNRFKQINDRYGHPTGDKVLQVAARRLLHAAGDVGTVARMGGDEFGVLLPSVTSPDDAAEVASRVHTEMRQACEVDGHRLVLGGSVGVALAPEHGDTFDALYARADVAMYAAKRDGAGPLVAQHEESRARARRPV